MTTLTARAASPLAGQQYRITDPAGAEALRALGVDRASAWAVAQAIGMGYHVELNAERVVTIGHRGRLVAMSVLLLDGESGRTKALFCSLEELNSFVVGVLRVTGEQQAP